MSNETVEQHGRQIHLEPLAPGLWGVILGVGLGTLAPLFGLLAGSMIGSADSKTLFGPQFIAMFIGIIIGGFGLVIAGLSGVRLYRHSVAQRPADD